MLAMLTFAIICVSMSHSNGTQICKAMIIIAIKEVLLEND